jgi:YVTN family beta-propeller protein/autotransporter-associated beta strand protein
MSEEFMKISSSPLSPTEPGPFSARHRAHLRAARWPLTIAIVPLACLGLATPSRAQIDVYGLLSINTSPGAAAEFDTRTNAPIGSNLTVGDYPVNAVFSPDGRFAYVVSSGSGSGSVSVIDVMARTIVNTIPASGNPQGLTISPNGQFLYITNTTNNTISVIATATNQVVGSPIAVGTNPVGVAVSPDGTTLYVTNITSDTVSVINATTRAVTTTVAVGTSPFGVSVSPDGSKAYIVNEAGGGTVSVINTATQTVIATIGIGGAPLSVAITPDGTRAYVANQSGSVSVIDTATESVIATIPISNGAAGVAITPNGSLAYVTTGNQTLIIDTVTNAVIGSVNTPIPGAVNVGTGFLGPNIIVAVGGPLSAANDAALTSLGFGQFVDFNGGTLRLTGTLNSARTISLLTLGGVIDTNGFSATLSGPIINSGALTKQGLGTLTLTGANTYTGGTFVTGGLINFNAANNFGTGHIALDGGGLQWASGNTTDISSRLAAFGRNGATFDTNGNNVTFGSALTGAGGLAKTGPGTLALAAGNTFTGATTINGGTLALTGAGSIATSSGVNVGPGAIFDISGTTTGAAIATLAGVAGGTVNLGSRTLTLSNASTIFGGNITGAGGLTLTGGLEMLTGTSTYAGATTINGGTLSVNGSIASSSLTTVNAGGTLGGNGTVGNTLINGGVLSPGNSIGLLTVQGNLVLTAASIYLAQVSPSAADRTNVTGAATLGGATVDASFAPGTYVARKYTILNATGGLNGIFSGPVNTNLPSGFQSSLSYDGNSVYLNLDLFQIPAGTNRNQQAVANALTDFFNRAGGIPMLYGGLTPAGLTQASGEIATGSQQTTFDAMTQFMGVMTDPFVAGRGDGVSSSAGAPQFADEDSASAYAAGARKRSAAERDAYAEMYRKAPMGAEVLAQRWSVWAAGFGGSQTTDGNAALGSSSATSQVFGTAVGADYRFSPDTLAGFALAGGGTNFSVANGGFGRSDLFQAGAFLRHNAGAAYLSAALAYGWQDITTNRTVTIAGADQLQARFNANAYSGRVEGGYRFATPWLGLTPYAAGQFTSFELPAYAESVLAGSHAFALSHGSQSVTDTRSELGLRADSSFALTNAILTLRGRAAWAHDFNPDRAVAATFQALPGASFVVNGAAQAQNSALTTASAELKWSNGVSLAATFDGEFSGVTRSYAGKGVVRFAW